MDVEPLKVSGAWRITPRQHTDDRGVFLEWFKKDAFQLAAGHPLRLGQASCSVSRRGTVRGVHFADLPPGQAKYVTCFHGAVLDVVVDIRVGSPTFGLWDSVLLDEDRRGVYVAEGLGHGFMALTDDATVSYLCSEPYAPGREHGINPLDPGLAIAWPTEVDLLLSSKDLDAPTLAEAARLGMLPSYESCQAYYASLRSSGSA